MKRVALLCALIVCLIVSAASTVAPGEVDFTSSKELPRIPDTFFDQHVSDTDSNVNALDAYAYSHTDARRLATIAAASYCAKYGTQSIYDWSCSHCKASGISMTDVSTMHIADINTWAISGYSSTGGGRLVLAFTGTIPSSWRNWLVDLSFGKVNYSPCAGCEVHTGFFYAYLRIRNQVIASLTDLQKKYPSAPLYITGHSLGGAIAVHAIADFYNHAFQVTKLNGEVTSVRGGNSAYDVTSPIISQEEALLLGGSVSTPAFTLMFPTYTFGQPRVGNDYFAAWFAKTLGSSRVYRLIHHRDPVPHVPLAAMGFRHPSTEVFYNSDSTKYSVCSGTNGEDPNCSNYFTFDLNISNHGVYAGYQFDQSASACP